MEIAAFQKEVFETAKDHGWWPMTTDIEALPAGGSRGDPKEYVDRRNVNIPEKLALMHSEISEALEHYREDQLDLFTDHSGKPDGFWIELGDCIIRILDLAGAYDIDMEYMLRVKADYNRTRPYRHGDKKC